ncbi:MAG: RMD1 family protein [Candidatus Hydrogenedentes bacterium]|nr:RMD1 family protein [Candidatus Hydrogenedentota bacterium]
MDTTLFAGRKRIRANAVLLADRIETPLLDVTGRIATTPLTIRAGSAGCVVVFRYGAVIMFGLEPIEEAAFLTDIKKLINEPHERLYQEQAELEIDSAADERVVQGVIVLRDAGVERLQLVADVLAESVVLERYEDIIAKTFDRVEPLAAALERGNWTFRSSKKLLSHIGGAMLIEHKMVGRIEVAEKPEVLWERVELEPLYARLATEYELRERQAALERKLKLTSRTVETVLDLLHHRRNLRVEWYIVILIVVEIMLTLYEMFWRGH